MWPPPVIFLDVDGVLHPLAKNHLPLHASEEDLKAIDKEIKKIVNESADFAKESPEPALEELWTDIYATEVPQEAEA